MLNPWSYKDWNLTQQGQIVTAYGLAKAEEMAEEAGTHVGGPRPAPPNNVTKVQETFILNKHQKGTSGGGATPNQTPTGSPGPARSLADLYADDFSHWKSEGIVGDGTTDDGPAFNTFIARVAAAGGGTIRVNGTFLINTALVFASNVTLDGGGNTTFKITSNKFRAFILNSCTRAAVKNCIFDLTGSSATSGFVALLTDAQECEVSGCKFLSLKGQIYLNGNAQNNRVVANKFSNSAAICVQMSGANVTGNIVGWNDITASASFGIFGDAGMNHNLIIGNKTVQNGVELIGLRYDCHNNRIIGNHAEGTGDNGISITGKYNVITGNICRKCYYFGIGVYGNYNVVTGNLCVSNGQIFASDGSSNYAGIGLQCNFGGLAQNNTIVGNTTDDDQASMTQAWGILISGANNTYTTWAASTVFGVNSYCKNGTNIYNSAAGGTSGATPPTHTSGTVSDGGVLWTYVDTWPSGREPVGNTVGPNAYYRSRLSVSVNDTTVNNYNNVHDAPYTRVHNTSAGTSQKYDVTGIIRHLQTWTNGQAVTYGNAKFTSLGHAYRVSNVGGTCANEPTHTSGTVTGADGIAWTLIALNTREMTAVSTPNGPAFNVDAALGLGRIDSPGNFLNMYAGSGSPEGVVTAPVGSIFLRSDGGILTTLYTKTGTGSTGWFPVAITKPANTFANLPASPVEGMLLPVTDSSTNVWGATITGGGANHVLAYYNGTNWTVAGK